MALHYDRLDSIVSNRESIRLVVRVARLWTVPLFNNPSQISSLEMLLVDENGGKIQGTVRKPLLHKFSSLLEEGCCYKMVYFNVVANSGGYRASSHGFRLIFLFKTTIQKRECPSISRYGLNCVPFNEILNYGDNHEYLIDAMGLLTCVYPERQYTKDGNITYMVVIELTDPSGTLECTLFGDYVDLLRGGGNVQVVVVLQLARVKVFRGKTVIPNSMNATRLLLDPDIDEAIAFRNSIAEHGTIDVEPLAVVLDSSRQGLEADFMKNNPKKTVSQLTSISEDGLFVVLGEIVDLVNDGSWFYLACNKCNRSVTSQAGVNYCEPCHIPVMHVYPRYKVKVEVADASGTCVLILFDRDVNLLIQKSCEDLLGQHFEEASGIGYPQLLQSLISKRMLFKVETKLEQAFQFEGTFPVRRVCYDETIISMFDLMGAETTPLKAVFVPPFSKVDTEMVDLKDDISQPDSEIIGTCVSLGDSHVGFQSQWTPPNRFTPAKRKLDVEFAATQQECSLSGVKKNNVVDVEDCEVPDYALVSVKLEKP